MLPRSIGSWASLKGLILRHRIRIRFVMDQMVCHTMFEDFGLYDITPLSASQCPEDVELLGLDQTTSMDEVRGHDSV